VFSGAGRVISPHFPRFLSSSRRGEGNLSIFPDLVTKLVENKINGIILIEEKPINKRHNYLLENRGNWNLFRLIRYLCIFNLFIVLA